MLTMYTRAIKAINIPNEQVKLRVNIAKLIIIEQRIYQNLSEGYRENINALKYKFSNDDLLSYFLSVSREFYTIWSDVQFTYNQEAS